MVAGVILRSALPRASVLLADLIPLYLNNMSAQLDCRKYRTRHELAVEMLRILCGNRENRCFHVLADSAADRACFANC